MKVGIALYGLYFRDADPALYPAVAQKAEQLGFESIWMGDHVVFPAEYVPEPEEGSSLHSAMRAGMHRPDTFTTLTYVAAVTKRLRLGTNIYILPLRNPWVTARTVGTLDWLSGGRVTLGIGVGWLRGEFEAVGERFEDRGRRTDEIVEILKRLWTQDVAEFHGTHYSFGPVRFEPKPVQRPHPPIHFGGTSEVALRRAARADGWVGGDSGLDRAGEFVQKLRRLRRELGVERRPFEITQACSATPTLEVLKRCQEAGADRILVAPWTARKARLSLDDVMGGMETFADKVLHKVG